MLRIRNFGLFKRMKSKKSKEDNMEKDQETMQETVDQQGSEDQVENDASTNADENNEQGEVTLDEVQQWKDKFLRLYSEFENYKRRTLKERIDLIQSANEKLLNNLLPVLDDFDRALWHHLMRLLQIKLKRKERCLSTINLKVFWSRMA